MAKAIKATITLPHGVSLKVDKLESRTIRTIKVGDYLMSSLDVRGTTCFFFAKVTQVQGSRVWTVFGSEDKPHEIGIAKGDKVNVYRPNPA